MEEYNRFRHCLAVKWYKIQKETSCFKITIYTSLILVRKQEPTHSGREIFVIHKKLLSCNSLLEKWRTQINFVSILLSCKSLTIKQDYYHSNKSLFFPKFNAPHRWSQSNLNNILITGSAFNRSIDHFWALENAWEHTKGEKESENRTVKHWILTLVSTLLFCRPYSENLVICVVKNWKRISRYTSCIKATIRNGVHCFVPL